MMKELKKLRKSEKHEWETESNVNYD
jgi:hypothetical protein